MKGKAKVVNVAFEQVAYSWTKPKNFQGIQGEGEEGKGGKGRHCFILWNALSANPQGRPYTQARPGYAFAHFS